MVVITVAKDVEMQIINHNIENQPAVIPITTYPAIQGLSNRQVKKNFDYAGMKKKEGQTFYLNGLNEMAMVRFLQQVENGELGNAEIFKGTRFGGHSYNPYGLYARVLKEGLPPGKDVSIGVKWKWDANDLIRYITEIQKMLGTQ